uniref:G-protein coupled receptors family 1 profile domain-containing protein n=1 Tax=Gasterosteus aculeatus aculeatus TaxID=481459 RepID=A0AAQ4PF99_GASAC|nr:trace amine-associated receptor 13c-like [Gasterosteus aculeatus aculeatus]
MKSLEDDELCFPHINSSCRKVVRPHFVSMLTYILLSSISLLTVTLNLMVIISISHFRQLHTPTNLLLLSLAVSDFFVGLIVFFQIVLIEDCWFLGDHMCILYTFLDYIITSASVGTMVLISVDRYVAICEPLHYSNKVTQKRVTICVCLCWTGSAIYSTLPLKDNLTEPGRNNSCFGECVIVINYIAGLADLFLIFIGPVTVIIVLYMRVFVVAVTQARVMRSHVAVLPHKFSMNITAKKSEMKAARTLGVVIVVFLLCVCPYYCVALSDQDTLINVSSGTIVVCVFYFNSCLNPLIYAFFYPWFRRSMKLIVTLEILQPGSCERNLL